MAMNLPGELVWVLDILGYEWPPIDEDELRRAASIVRVFGEDLDASIEAVDRTITGDVAKAMRTGSNQAYATAWTTNRSTNLQQLVDVMPECATGIDLFADAVVAMKVKVIAELVITAAQIAAAAASAVLTLGLSAAASAAIIVARKKALDILTDIAVEAIAGQVLTMLVEPMAHLGTTVATAIAEAPVVEGAVADVNEFEADLDALETAAGDLEKTGGDQERLVDDFLSQISSCRIVTG